MMNCRGWVGARPWVQEKVISTESKFFFQTLSKNNPEDYLSSKAEFEHQVL